MGGRTFETEGRMVTHRRARRRKVENIDEPGKGRVRLKKLLSLVGKEIKKKKVHCRKKGQTMPKDSGGKEQTRQR